MSCISASLQLDYSPLLLPVLQFLTIVELTAVTAAVTQVADRSVTNRVGLRRWGADGGWPMAAAAAAAVVKWVAMVAPQGHAMAAEAACTVVAEAAAEATGALLCCVGNGTNRTQVYQISHRGCECDSAALDAGVLI